jgi:hypothetical protein
VGASSLTIGGDHDDTVQRRGRPSTASAEHALPAQPVSNAPIVVKSSPPRFRSGRAPPARRDGAAKEASFILPGGRRARFSYGRPSIRPARSPTDGSSRDGFTARTPRGPDPDHRGCGGAGHVGDLQRRSRPARGPRLQRRPGRRGIPRLRALRERRELDGDRWPASPCPWSRRGLRPGGHRGGGGAGRRRSRGPKPGPGPERALRTRPPPGRPRSSS